MYAPALMFAHGITSPDVPIRIPVLSTMTGTNITEDGIYCLGKVKQVLNEDKGFNTLILRTKVTILPLRKHDV